MEIVWVIRDILMWMGLVCAVGGVTALAFWIVEHRQSAASRSRSARVCSFRDDPVSDVVPSSPNRSTPGLYFYNYRRTNLAQMAQWLPGTDMSGVSVSDADCTAGSPKEGDMIARNPDDHKDKWLVAADYFAANFGSYGEACDD